MKNNLGIIKKEKNTSEIDVSSTFVNSEEKRNYVKKSITIDTELLDKALHYKVDNKIKSFSSMLEEALKEYMNK